MPNTLPNKEFRKQNREHAANMRSLMASGDLSSFGQDRSPNAPLTFEGLEAVFVEYGEKFVRGFAAELAADKTNAYFGGSITSETNASGAGAASIRFEFHKLGKGYETRIFMADYLKFVDLGVQGAGASTRNKTSPFKFKFINPSKSHRDALEKWIREKNVRAIVTAPKGLISKELSAKSLAYVIGRSSKSQGLYATYFKRKTVDKLSDEFKQAVIAAAGEDLKVNIIY
jgi:hypothetical protein